MAFSIRLSDDEKRLAESYARLHAVTVGEAFKKALFEKIEDEFDLSAADAAYQEYVDSGKVSRPFSELKKELE